MIKAVIFDYYGVLTTDLYLNWLERHPGVIANHGPEILELSQDQDEGISADEFFGRLATITRQPEESIRAAFHIHGVYHHGLVDYVRHLRRRGFKTAILSNSPRSLYAEVAKHHLTHLFDVVLCSEEARATKPDPKIFRLILKRLDVLPSEALFIDDRAYNVNGAKAIGMHGILYTGLSELREEFIARDLDVPR